MKTTLKYILTIFINIISIQLFILILIGMLHVQNNIYKIYPTVELNKNYSYAKNNIYKISDIYNENESGFRHLSGELQDGKLPDKIKVPRGVESVSRSIVWPIGAEFQSNFWNSFKQIIGGILFSITIFLIIFFVMPFFGVPGGMICKVKDSKFFIFINFILVLSFTWYFALNIYNSPLKLFNKTKQIFRRDRSSVLYVVNGYKNPVTILINNEMIVTVESNKISKNDIYQEDIKSIKAINTNNNALIEELIFVKKMEVEETKFIYNIGNKMEFSSDSKSYR